MFNEQGFSFRAASVIISACKAVIEHDRVCKDYLSFKSKEHLWCAQYFWWFSQPSLFFSHERKINILYLAKLLSCSERGIPDMRFCLAGNEVEVTSPEAILSYHEGPHANIWFLPALLPNKAGYDYAYAYIISHDLVKQLHCLVLNFKN